MLFKLVAVLKCLAISALSAPNPLDRYFLQNHFVKVGISPNAGGAISFLAPMDSGA